MSLSDEAVLSLMKGTEECFCHIKLFLLEVLEEEDGGIRGLMFLSEEAALQTDSSLSTAFRLKQGF